ncbi:hypothetical protein [Gracilimonas sp.]|uniref:hypothetical protein n=1 Tax=Gracilimonas sp. TaxID=1974203 RepID=UPI0032EC8916
MKSDLKKEILSLATEDYFGLYEIIWGLNNEFPELSEAKKISRSKKAISELLQEELIQLYKIEVSNEKYVLIPADEIGSFLEKAESWKPGSSYIGFTATLKGE